MEKVEKKEFVATPIEALDDSNVNISDFLIALINFENLLQEFSESTELDIYDLNGSLVYTDDGRLINTRPETIQPFVYPVANPCFENMKCLSEALTRIFMDGEFKSERLQLIQRRCQVEGSIRPSKFISEALEKMDKVIDVNTISDYQKGLTLLRK